MRGSSFNSTPITGSTFTTMSNSLTNMSNALGAYPATPSSRPYQSVVFNCPAQGCDPELNVFSVTADQAAGATSFDFTNVPPDSAVIVNIAGKTASIANAGFIPTNDVPPYGKILWNFPQATSLHTRISCPSWFSTGARLRDPLIGIKEFQTLEQKPVARKLGGQMRPLGAQATPPASLEWLHTNSCLG